MYIQTYLVEQCNGIVPLCMITAQKQPAKNGEAWKIQRNRQISNAGQRTFNRVIRIDYRILFSWLRREILSVRRR